MFLQANELVEHDRSLGVYGLKSENNYSKRHDYDAQQTAYVAFPYNGFSIKKTKSIEFRKEGYYTESEQVNPDFEFWYLGNLLFGGLPGMIVDLSTGSYNKMPEKIETELKEKPEDKKQEDSK